MYLYNIQLSTYDQHECYHYSHDEEFTEEEFLEKIGDAVCALIKEAVEDEDYRNLERSDISLQTAIGTWDFYKKFKELGFKKVEFTASVTFDPLMHFDTGIKYDHKVPVYVRDKMLKTHKIEDGKWVKKSKKDNK